MPVSYSNTIARLLGILSSHQPRNCPCCHCACLCHWRKGTTVASWLHIPSSNVIGLFSSIVVMWRLFCRAHILSINVVLTPVSISAFPTTHLPHGSFQIAGKVITLPWPGLFSFSGLVCFPILGLRGYSLPLQSSNCNGYVRLSHTESIFCFSSFYLLSASYPGPWRLSRVPMLPA